jgi:hypothetical protein
VNAARGDRHGPIWAGLPESFFASPGIRTGDDAYTVMANVTWQFNTVEENAKANTRKQLYVVRETLAKKQTFCSQ